MVSIMHGATLILSSPTFDGKKVLEAIRRERWASVGSYPQVHETLLVYSLLGPDPSPRCLFPPARRNGDRVVGDPRKALVPPLVSPVCSPQL